MEVTVMAPKHTNSFQSRFSSLLKTRSQSSKTKLTRKPTISNPTQTIVSHPPRRLRPSPLPIDLEARAISTLTTLRSDKDFSTASEFISEQVRYQQDEEDEVVFSRDEFLSSWDSDASSQSSDFELEVLEAAVDEVQRKVWIRSEIRGQSGVTKENVDMITFDSEGLLVACIGSQRTVSRRTSSVLDD